MPKLDVEKKTILELFSNNNADFLIPDYQRSYAWNEEQCRKLWYDIYSFAVPEDNHENFKKNQEYYLGSIVTYKNDKGQSEIIDGQQRLTTLLLILRAFYDKFEKTMDDKSKYIHETIARCIWKTGEFQKINKDMLKIESKVATDNDKEEFLGLLRTGEVKQGSKSRYVLNYQFFKKTIDNLSKNYPTCCPYIPERIFNDCILLFIEAESQDTALRIFSTLNDRGLPLSDAYIFKAQLYKHYSELDRKDEFISKWKELEEISNSVFKQHTAPMDELFTRYMYFLRAKEKNKDTTTEALRKFYEHDNYQYLKKDTTIEDLKALVLFWESVSCQDEKQFSKDILKKFFVLEHAPNRMWQYITSVYFLQHRNINGELEETKFSAFLSKITAFIFAYAVINPGVSALRTPVYDEMVRIVNDSDVTFSSHKFKESQTRLSFENYEFSNQSPLTRSMITWYAYTFPEQQLLDSKENFQLEHIYAKKRQEIDGGLQDQSSIESLGNKMLLERSINIKASDYQFEVKKKIYSGEMRRGKNKDKSKIAEITILSNKTKFDEQQIIERNKDILDKFFNFLHSENLIAD